MNSLCDLEPQLSARSHKLLHSFSTCSGLDLPTDPSRNSLARPTRFSRRPPPQRRAPLEPRQPSQSQHEQVGAIKYLPMAELLSYKGEPVRNRRLLERRLLNRIKSEQSYY